MLQKAICPEKRAGLDSALSAIASVTEVRVSNDLQVAKVYISIFSDDRGKETAMRQLNKLQGCAAFLLHYLTLAQCSASLTLRGVV